MCITSKSSFSFQTRTGHQVGTSDCPQRASASGTMTVSRDEVDSRKLLLTCVVGGSSGVDKPYPVYGGIFREEAIMLLRKFYVQENEKGVSTS